MAYKSNGITISTYKNGSSLQVRYQNATSKDELKYGEGDWGSTIPNFEAGKKTFMQQKLSTQSDEEWSEPIQISAEDGQTPTIDIVVNEDGKKVWAINGEATSHSAEGQEGHSPVLTIDPDSGEWLIDGKTTNIKAQGPAGQDGASTEFVYYLRRTINGTLQPAPTNAPAYNGNGELTQGWTKSPTGITESNPEEYMSIRTKPQGTDTQWGPFSNPVIWSKWGEKGQDGDGVEYKYYRKNKEEKPTYSATDSNWKDEPQGVNSSNRFEYVAVIATKHEEGKEPITTTKVALWAKYSEDGTSPYSIELDNDSAVIVTDKDGNNGSYGDNAKTTITVYCGNIIDTGWTYSISPQSSDNLTYTVTNSNRTIAISKMSADKGELTITATKPNCPTLTRIFKISKLKQGEKGTDATSYWLTSSLGSIVINKNNQYKDSSIVFTAKKQIGSTTPQSYATKLVAYKDGSTNPLSSSTNGTLTISLTNQKPTKEIRCVMYYGTNGTVILDEESVSVIKDGTDGTPPTVEEKYIFQGSKDYICDIAAPIDSNLPPEDWSFEEPSYNKDTKENSYIYRSSQLVVGNTANEKGWSAPILYKYLGQPVEENQRTFLELTKGGEKFNVFYGDNELYINANFIQSGTLRVAETGKTPIFNATIDGANPSVNIAGWEAKQLHFNETNNNETKGFYNYANLYKRDGNGDIVIEDGKEIIEATISTGMASSNSIPAVAFWAGCKDTSCKGGTPWTTTNYQEHTPFYVTNDGVLHATDAIISGNITAKEGHIGGWEISGQTLVSKDEKEDILASFGPECFLITKPGFSFAIGGSEIYIDRETGITKFLTNEQFEIGNNSASLLFGTQGTNATVIEYTPLVNYKPFETIDYGFAGTYITLDFGNALCYRKFVTIETFFIKNQDGIVRDFTYSETFTKNIQPGEYFVEVEFEGKVVTWEQDTPAYRRIYKGYGAKITIEGFEPYYIDWLYSDYKIEEGEEEYAGIWVQLSSFEQIKASNVPIICKGSIVPENYGTSYLGDKDKYFANMYSKTLTAHNVIIGSGTGEGSTEWSWFNNRVGFRGGINVESTFNSWEPLNSTSGNQTKYEGFTSVIANWGRASIYSTGGYTSSSSYNNCPFMLITHAGQSKQESCFWVDYDGNIKVLSHIQAGSDRNIKNSIEPVANSYDTIFDQLKPVTYKYNDGSSNRTHMGLIAQDVEEAIINAGLTTQDFAVVCYDLDENNSKTNYTIRYEELIPMNIYEIQRLKSRLSSAESEISQLKTEVENLKKSQNSVII